MVEDVRVFDLSFNDAHVEMAVGAIFEVALPEQPTTGFKWKIVSGQTPVADFRDPPASNRGGETIRHLRFQASQKGELVVSLELRRSWERDKAAAKTFTIHVAVG